jgi:hypothetical protein
MVINTIKGLHVDGFAIAEAMNHPSGKKWYTPVPRIPNSATFPWGIVEVFSEYRIKSTWQPFTSFARLSNLLSYGNMVIVLTANYQARTAHYRILVAINPDNLGFVDPAYPEGIIQFQPMDSFISSWQKALDTIINIPNQ